MASENGAVYRAECSRKTKIVKDVVHAFVELPEDIMDTLVDKPLFQRLRDIRQLSLAELVYPGAAHTRFEHSLGVSHVMATAVDRIASNIREHVIPALLRAEPPTRNLRELSKALAGFMDNVARRLRRLKEAAVVAALLHDAGHITLSHAAEAALRDPILLSTPEPWKTMVETKAIGLNHELIGLAILARLGECVREGKCTRIEYQCSTVNLETVAEILEIAYIPRARAGKCGPVLFRADGSRLVDVFQPPQPGEATRVAKCVIAQLLNSVIDVDRADYILRDSIHTGSRSGIYDINRYYMVLTVVPRITISLPEKEFHVHFHLGILDKGVSVIENMLLSRVYMYSDIYLHDVSMIYGALAQRLISLLYATGRILSSRAHEGDGEARELLDKYDYLDSIARLPLVTEAASFDEVLDTLSNLTDTPFLYTVKRIAMGRARDLLNYLSKLDEDGETWHREACASIVLAARGIVARRHWSALVLSGERATRIIQRLSGREGPSVLPRLTIDKYIQPLLTISWSKYVAYSKAPAPLYVFQRRSPLSPVEITESPAAKIADRIAEALFAKLVITVPRGLDDKGLPGWTLRRSKLGEEDIARAGEWCRTGREWVEERLSKASEDATRLAGSMIELV